MKPSRQGIGIVGPEGCGAPKGGGRFSQLALADQDIAEVVVSDWVPRPEAKSFTETAFGLLRLPQGEEDSTEIVVRLGIFRDEAQRLSTAGFRFGKAPESG